MKYPENIQEVAALCPDYMGFIFFDQSARNFSGPMPEIDAAIKKTGVFVDASFEIIRDKIREYGFKAVQLHGRESPLFCRQIKALGVEVFKVFSVKNDFDFSRLTPYEKEVDYFLFDTKGKYPGGNGIIFNWKLLQAYPSEVPLILSGGIGPEEIASLKELMEMDLPLYAIDINSRFENKPALKDVELLKEFFNKIR